MLSTLAIIYHMQLLTIKLFSTPKMKAETAHNFTDWSTQLVNLVDNNKLSIAQLNINSYVQKAEEVIKILNFNVLDILMLSETKINENISDEAVKHPFYSVVRRHRTRNGGGLLIYYKLNIKLSKIEIDARYELISFKLSLKQNSYCSFLMGYRPPNDAQDDFLDNLEMKILSYNLDTDKLFILGDLNYNLLSKVTCGLVEFWAR